MGLQGSPASFARLIDYVMRGLRGVLTYIDDVLVHTSTQDGHLEQLEEVFLRLRKYNLKLNVAKSEFGSSEVTYRVSEQGYGGLVRFYGYYPYCYFFVPPSV